MPIQQVDANISVKGQEDEISSLQSNDDDKSYDVMNQTMKSHNDSRSQEDESSVRHK